METREHRSQALACSKLNFNEQKPVTLIEGDEEIIVHGNLEEIHFTKGVKYSSVFVRNLVENKLVESKTLTTLAVSNQEVKPEAIRRVCLSNTLTKLHLYNLQLTPRQFLALAAGMRHNTIIQWVTLAHIESERRSKKRFPWSTWVPALQGRSRFCISSNKVTNKDALCFKNVLKHSDTVEAARFHLLPVPYSQRKRGEMWRIVLSAIEKSPNVQNLLLDTFMSPVYLGTRNWEYIQSVLLRDQVRIQNVSGKCRRPKLM